jgi:hypothetical protein
MGKIGNRRRKGLGKLEGYLQGVEGKIRLSTFPVHPVQIFYPAVTKRFKCPEKRTLLLIFKGKKIATYKSKQGVRYEKKNARLFPGNGGVLLLVGISAGAQGVEIRSGSSCANYSHVCHRFPG